MKLNTVLFFFLLISNSLSAQIAHFITDGKIEYDKTVNMYAILRKQINKDNEVYMKPAYEAFQRNNPQFRTLKSTLSFSKDKTLFDPIPSENPVKGYFTSDPTAEQNNIIFTDLKAASSVSQKKVFEETFLVKDSTRAIKWKITGETREIAGYFCRRANAVIMDSIYVVAFYTDEIPLTGGPESFTGLPGMILGVALPHDGVTWFATKVSEQPIPATVIAPPKKGKAVDNKALKATLNSALKNWGDEAQAFLRGFML
jgi:GLPGLI family protein